MIQNQSYQEISQKPVQLDRVMDKDHSIVVVSIGFLQNLAQLLQSPADDISSLSGYDLVNSKVNSVVIMGGIYPQSFMFSAYNFNCGLGTLGNSLECTGSARSAVENMPPGVKMVFSGFEVGV